MKKDYSAELHKINYLSSEIEALYHVLSVKLGISDSESITMYTIYTEGEECLLSDIYKASGISKQTINSAIRNLEKKEIVTLSNFDGRSKKVSFTPKGRKYAESTVGVICKAENAAFAAWTDSEVEMFLGLMQKYYDSFKTEINKL